MNCLRKNDTKISNGFQFIAILLNHYILSQIAPPYSTGLWTLGLVMTAVEIGSPPLPSVKLLNAMTVKIAYFLTPLLIVCTLPHLLTST